MFTRSGQRAVLALENNTDNRIVLYRYEGRSALRPHIWYEKVLNGEVSKTKVGVDRKVG